MTATTRSEKASKRNMLIALGAALVVATVGYVLVLTKAAGFFASVDAGSANLSGNASLITESDGSKSLQFNAPAAPPPPPVPTTCPLPKYPTPDCAGRLLTSGFSKTVNGDYTAATAGESIDNWHVTGVLKITAQNVNITNSQIDGGVQNFQAPSSSFTLTDSTVGPPSGCSGGVTLWGNNYTALRIHSRNMENGISTTSGNLTVRDSFSTTCSPSPDAHADGFETCCDINAQYPNITLDHNTFDQRTATAATAPIDLAEALHVTNVNITNNLVAGGAYSMYLENYTAPSPSTPKWVIAGNKLVANSWAFDAVTTKNTCANLDWRPGNDWVTIDSNYNITSTVRSNEPCTP